MLPSRIQWTYTSSLPDFSQFFTAFCGTTMAAIFHPHGAKIPDIENRLKPWSQFHMNQKRDWERQWNMEKSMTVLKISLKRLPITFCSPKITHFSSQRFHSQKALGLHKGSDAVFQPSIGILARADREFEFLGPRTTLQGSAKKLDDAPKLKLPEVSCYLSYC